MMNVFHWLGLGLAVLAPVTPAPTTAPPVRPAPIIEFKALKQDGGTVEEGTILKFHFVVANRGSSDLEIKEVQKSCGCTVARWDKLIPRGKNGSIDAEVNTLHFRGPIMKHLTVITNDPRQPLVELNLSANVTPLVQVEPGIVALLTVEDQPATQIFILERPGRRAMKITQVISSTPFLKTDLRPLPEPGRYQLTVTATMETPMGRSPTPILVKTDVERAETVTITLIVDRGIVTTPPMLFYSVPTGEMKEPISNVVTVMRQKPGFHVTGASVDDPKLKVEVRPAIAGSDYRINLTYTGGWEAGLLHRTLTVTTDDPKQPVLTIPVQAMVQNPAANPISPPGR